MPEHHSAPGHGDRRGPRHTGQAEGRAPRAACGRRSVGGVIGRPGQLGRWRGVGRLDGCGRRLVLSQAGNDGAGSGYSARALTLRSRLRRGSTNSVLCNGFRASAATVAILARLKVFQATDTVISNTNMLQGRSDAADQVPGERHIVALGAGRQHRGRSHLEIVR